MQQNFLYLDRSGLYVVNKVHFLLLTNLISQHLENLLALQFSSSLPLGLLHSKTAVFWSTSQPGDLSQCEPGQSNNPWELQCFCLSPEWNAGVDWSPSSALQHSPLPQSPWCWSACASHDRWEVLPCWKSRFVLSCPTCPGWKWSWKVTWWQFSCSSLLLFLLSIGECRGRVFPCPASAELQSWAAGKSEQNHYSYKEFNVLCSLGWHHHDDFIFIPHILSKVK